jgi:hypothetical protein
MVTWHKHNKEMEGRVVSSSHVNHQERPFTISAFKCFCREWHGPSEVLRSSKVLWMEWMRRDKCVSLERVTKSLGRWILWPVILAL